MFDGKLDGIGKFKRMRVRHADASLREHLGVTKRSLAAAEGVVARREALYLRPLSVEF